MLPFFLVLPIKIDSFLYCLPIKLVIKAFFTFSCLFSLVSSRAHMMLSAAVSITNQCILVLSVLNQKPLILFKSLVPANSVIKIKSLTEFRDSTAALTWSCVFLLLQFSQISSKHFPYFTHPCVHQGEVSSSYIHSLTKTHSMTT